MYLLTKDQTIVDNELVRSIFTLLDTCFITLIVIASLNYFYLGVLLLFTIVIGVMVYSINYRFSKVSQRLLAFTNKSRAELTDLYLDTLDNLSMLRSNGKGEYFIDKFYEKTDSYQLAYTNLYNYSMRWLNMNISILSIFTILSITTVPFFMRLWMSDYIDPKSWQLSYSLGTASLVLASILNFARFYPQT